MKIRTDFVTNSSSESSAEVVIDNPLLLEILVKYKEMGAFCIDEDDIEWRIGSRYDEEGFSREFSEELKEITKTPAFFYYGDNVCHPHLLDEVLESILCILEKDVDDHDIYSQMTNDLREIEVEIKANYLKVFWLGGIASFGSEVFSETEYLIDELEYKDLIFYYDPKNIHMVNFDWEFKYDPQNGESFNIEYNVDEQKT